MIHQRHQLVYVNKNTNFKLVSLHQRMEAAVAKAVDEWIKQGLPCIYARQCADNNSIINLGLPVLIKNKIHRAALQLNKDFIENESTLPSIEQFKYFFSNPINTSIICESIYVYGSFLFQHLSKLPFVHIDSDFDILIDYQKTPLSLLHSKIAELAIETRRTIDGEVRFKTIGDIPLNELINLSASKLLVKTVREVKLITREELYEHYPTLSN